MAYQLFDPATGVIIEPKKKTVKRKGGFFMMNLIDSERIATDKELHGTEYKVLFFILSRINFENIATMTQTYMANALNMPQSQVSAAVKKLSERGAVRKLSINGQNGYEVSPSLVSRVKLESNK